jgi:hypothetical protein
MDQDHNYVYVMASIENGVPVAPCKIGITRSLQGRLSSVQTGNPKKLVVFSAIYIPNRMVADVVEQCIHEWFDEFRLAGEWFNVGPVDAAIGCCSMAKEAFLALGMDEDQAHECLDSFGISATIRSCFEFVKHCKAKGLPLETRF